MDVYLDAVFHPAMLNDENVFRQEGWPYELSESGELSTSGVVLNEMRGAYSSVEDVELEYMKRMLYPDTCYRHDSGGAPDDITSLTYEEFVRLHKKYYHPSNSYIFLDGSVELEPALSLIDSYLSEYDAEECEFDIPDQPPVCPDVLYEEYEISSGESEENKTRLSLGFGGWRFDEQMKAFAINVLLDTLVSSNESPIKKAMLDSGLCEDLEPFFCDSVKENIVCLGFRNVKDGKWEELAALFFDTVQSIAEKGIERELLISSLNSYEFKILFQGFSR